MPTLFIPAISTKLDGPIFTHATKWNDMAANLFYNEVIPGPSNTALPRRSLSTVTTPALTTKCRGMGSFRTQAGVDMVFAGDTAGLYRAFTSVTGTFTFSNIGGSYATGAGESWEFASFAKAVVAAEGPTVFQQRIIATNFSDHVQMLDVRGSATHTFSALITSSTPPKARHLGVIGQFLVLGNIDLATSSTANYAPSRVHWSAFGNPRSFAPSAGTQCDFEDLQTGGAVQKIIGGNEYGLIFQETQIQVFRYIGGTTIFDISPVAHAPGTPVPNSVISYGGAVYYIATEGFMMLDAGLGLKRIGNNMVDRFIWDNLTPEQIHDVSVSSDPINKMIWWAFPTDTAGFAKQLLGYKIDDGRWARWSQPVEQIGLIRRGMASEMFTAFDTDHKLKTWTADTPNSATFSTGWVQPVPGRRWQLNGIRFLADAGDSGITPTLGSVIIDGADKPTTAFSSTVLTVSINSLNYVNVRVAGLYISMLFQFNLGALAIPNAKFIGFELDYELLGGR